MNRSFLRALGSVLGGAALLLFGITAQVSSYFTPFLAHKTSWLRLASSGGIVILSIAIICCIGYGLRGRGSPTLYGLAVFYAVLAVLIHLTLWGKVFQLAVAGIVVGGSLLVSGLVHLHVTWSNNQAK